jgi:ABC-type multidrug transport system ATPase subunit
MVSSQQLLLLNHSVLCSNLIMVASLSMHIIVVQLVQDAITKLMVNRTVIIIAHRLSTVKDADVIAVFGKGKIIDAGRHEELLRTSNTYANLVRKQLSGAHSMQGPLAEEAVEGESLSGGQVVTLLEDAV